MTVRHHVDSSPPDVPPPLPPRNPFIESLEQLAIGIFEPIEEDLRFLLRLAKTPANDELQGNDVDID